MTASTAQTLVAVAALATSAWNNAMSDNEFRRSESLIGLKALAVTFDVNWDAEAYGLLVHVWLAEIEARLTEAGIEVIELQRIAEVTGSPILTVCVRALRLEGYPEGWACLISLDLDEWAYPARGQPTRAFACTWHTGLIATAQGLNLGKLAGPFMDCVHQFVSEYQAANECSVQ